MLLDLRRKAAVMGILNVTPDSFSDGGRHNAGEAALQHAREMIREGAAILDIGGESTRPGSQPVSVEEELRRTIPMIEALRQEWDGLISIDTCKAEVACKSLAAGADIVNDIAGLRDPAMVEVCRESGCGVVVMHMQGTPQTMQEAPHYEDVVAEVASFFRERYETLVAAGIDPLCLCFDPGIGFGKTQEHNLSLLRNLKSLSPHGRPLLLGVSRKGFLGRLIDSADVAERKWPTVAVTVAAREDGVMLHRVHDVRENREALRMVEAIGQGCA